MAWRAIGSVNLGLAAYPLHTMCSVLIMLPTFTRFIVWIFVWLLYLRIVVVLCECTTSGRVPSHGLTTGDPTSSPDSIRMSWMKAFWSSYVACWVCAILMSNTWAAWPSIFSFHRFPSSDRFWWALSPPWGSRFRMSSTYIHNIDVPSGQGIKNRQ